MESVLAVQLLAYCPWAQTVITAHDKQAVALAAEAKFPAAQTIHTVAPCVEV